MPLARAGERGGRIGFEITGWHHTNHGGTVVAEDHRAQRAGETLGQIEYPQPRKDASHDQNAVRVTPPSTTISAPVMNDASSDSRNRTAVAMSSGRPTRRNGDR